MRKCLILVFALVTGISLISNAQVLDSENVIGLTLSDGTQVLAMGRANTVSSGDRYGKFSNEYYYLPTNLRLSKKPDGTPEFIFVKYTTDEAASAGGVQGALMHFLMEWGLTPAQEQELQLLIKEKIGNLKTLNPLYENVVDPIVAGPVNLKSDIEGETFMIVSGTLTNSAFTPNMSTSGRAPLLPGSKIAVAAVLEKNGAQLLASTFENARSITDVSVALRFQYEILTPAVEGKITMDWSQLHTKYQSYHKDYTKKDKKSRKWYLFGAKTTNSTTVTENEREAMYDFFKQSNIVDIKLDNLQPTDPVAQEVTRSFMDMFLQSITDQEMEKPENGEVESLKPGEPYVPKGKVKRYEYNASKIERMSRRGKQEFNLNYRIPVVREFSITENLAAWYDGVKHNSKCITSVNLNDPFFQHREINLILDGEAERMFGDELNAISVDIRKKRSNGNDFQDAIMINKQSLASGTLATLTYARGEDENADVYEYRTSWNLKGKVYPESPRWEKGDWKGINLISPVSPRKIEFECDLVELKEFGFPRATLQLRYMKFGEEFETNIPLTVSKGQGLVEKTIFTDRDTRGYAYRLIMTHKKYGKMVLPWEEKINDDYVYATIPPEAVDEGSEIFKSALAIGKAIASPRDGEVNKVDSILDQFKNIFEAIKSN